MSKHHTPPPKPLKPLLKVRRLLRNIDGAVPVVAVDMQFRTDEGELQSIIIPKGMVDSPLKILEVLRDAGAFLPEADAAKEIIKRALKPIFDPTKRLVSIDRTSRTGWHSKSFVLPGLTFGVQRGKLEFSAPTEPQAVYGQGGENNPAKLILSEAGTLKGWKDALTAPCKLSSELPFIISTAFAALLLEISDLQEAAIFILCANSGSGKTLACRAALSVYRNGMACPLADYNQTDTALEEFCASHNHMLVVVDDTGTAGKTQMELDRQLTKMAYTLTSGKGKQRSSKVQNNGLPNLTFRNIIVTSSEDSLHKIATDSRRKLGAEVRLIEIPVRRKESGGIFHRAHSALDDPQTESSQKFANIGRGLKENYGVAIGPFVQALVDDYDQLAGMVTSMTREFLDDVGVGSDSAEIRIAKKFALVCAGGRIAARYGVAPWSDKRIRAASKTLFNRTMRLYRGGDPKAMTANEFARMICHMVEAKPKSFPRVEKGGRTPPIPEDALLGVRRRVRGIDCLLIPKDRMATIVGRREIPRGVIDTLKQAGALPFASAHTATTQVTVMGWPCAAKRPGFYVLPIEKLRSITESVQGKS